MLVLDTHALVWTMSDLPQLGAVAKAEIASALADSAVAVSAIAFWEITMLSKRGRITIFSDPADRLITATAVVNRATLVTADWQILEWSSPLRRIDARR